MLRVDNYGDVAKIAGSFWVDNDRMTLHIHSFDGENQNNTLLNWQLHITFFFRKALV